MRLQFLPILFIVSVAIAAQPALAKPEKIKDDDSQYTNTKESAMAVDVDDPWYNVNQPIFDFNLGFDRHIAKPFIQTYDYIPHEVRHGVDNFLTNLSEPLGTIHGILQLDPKAAFTSLWRFILNTTFGFAGIRDFAREDAGLHHVEENLGKTLGRWGIPAGPYVVLPILGPSSARDTTGKIGDWFADPVGWLETTPEEIGQAVADGIDTRDTESGIIDHLYYQSLDPYVATRSAYRQHETFEENNRN